MLIIFCGLLGLVMGSLLTIITYRLPFMMRHSSKLTFFQPPSHCPECRHTLSFKETLPLFSYLTLKGKCHYCQQPIALRYPLIEASSLLLSMALTVHFGATLMLIGALCLSFGLIALTFIDLSHFLLPDKITLPLLWLGLTFNLFHLFTPLHHAVTGAILAYLILWGIALFFKSLTGKDGLGHGDFKLLACIGAWLGYVHLPLIICLSSLLAIMVRLSYFRHKKNSYFAFGPYLCGTTLIVLFWHYPSVT